jgi:DNA-binding MarR family transcriptional regulator
MSPSDDLVAAVRVLARLHRLLEAADSGLTLPQYRVLAALTQGGVRSAHLAERLTVRRPTLTAIADGLVAAGLATRESEPGDRRVVRLHPTPAGEDALRLADAAYTARLGPLLDGIAHPGRLVADLIELGGALDARLASKLAAVEPDVVKPNLVKPNVMKPNVMKPNVVKPAADV